MIFFLVLDPSICHSLWLLRLSNSRSCLEVFINVSNVSYKSCALLWFAKKGKYLLQKSVCFHLPPPPPKKKKKKKNWYATIQMVLKYPLPINWSNPFKPIHLLADATFNHSLMLVASYIVKTDLKKILTKLLILDQKIINFSHFAHDKYIP